MKKKILLWLFRKNPQAIADILIQDFLGIIPTKAVDKSAMEFLARNKGVFEPWLIKLSYTLQKENVTQRENIRKDEFYNGAIFVIRLLYSLTAKDLPVQFPPNIAPKNIKNPQGDVDNFLTGMENKKNGQENVSLSEGESNKV